MANSDVQLTLEEAVQEVLQGLTGLNLSYDPSQDRFQSVVRSLNKAMRDVALEHEWSYFSSTEDAGQIVEGVVDYEVSSKLRPRVINDDAVRLLDSDGVVRVWAYILPRDALHKYANRNGLWVAFVRNTMSFSRPPFDHEIGMRIQVPVMREPRMFRLPRSGRDIPTSVLRQPIDFDYPDLVVAKAMQLYAGTDPVMQPRVQTLEAAYKDRMYQLVERDERFTDSPYLNDFFVPIQGSLDGVAQHPMMHGPPHSDERW